MTRPPAAAIAQLVVSSVVIGVGVALLLQTSLGSDGYSAAVNGLSRTSGWSFWSVNCLVGLALITMAWVRGTRPGLGTIVQPVVVGFTVNAGLRLVPEPTDVQVQSLMLLSAFILVTLGVAGYLGSSTGAGPVEAAALAWDPPVAFGWTYAIVQGGGALVGWLLGSAIGPGTLLVVVALGPSTAAVLQYVPSIHRRHG